VQIVDPVWLLCDFSDAAAAAAAAANCQLEPSGLRAAGRDAYLWRGEGGRQSQVARFRRRAGRIGGASAEPKTRTRTTLSLSMNIEYITPTRKANANSNAKQKAKSLKVERKSGRRTSES